MVTTEGIGLRISVKGTEAESYNGLSELDRTHLLRLIFEEWALVSKQNPHWKTDCYRTEAVVKLLSTYAMLEAEVRVEGALLAIDIELLLPISEETALAIIRDAEPEVKLEVPTPSSGPNHLKS